MSILELQRLALSGDQAALTELGRKVLDFKFHLSLSRDDVYCEHEVELRELEFQLDNEIPPDCPHCGGAIA